MPPDCPPIVGKEEVRSLSREYVASFEEKCRLAYDEVEVAGDWGYVRATVTGTRGYSSGGGLENLSLKNLRIVAIGSSGASCSTVRIPLPENN
jgi:ketosteroid isomerase-like protein